MSIELEEMTVILFAVPLMALALGLYLALGREHATVLRLAGSLLAVLGPLQIAAMLLWFERGCFETWQPCGRAPGFAVGLLWAGLALALVVASVTYLITVLSRRGGVGGSHP